MDDSGSEFGNSAGLWKSRYAVVQPAQYQQSSGRGRTIWRPDSIFRRSQGLSALSCVPGRLEPVLSPMPNGRASGVHRLCPHRRCLGCPDNIAADLSRAADRRVRLRRRSRQDQTPTDGSRLPKRWPTSDRNQRQSAFEDPGQSLSRYGLFLEKRRSVRIEPDRKGDFLAISRLNAAMSSDCRQRPRNLPNYRYTKIRL